jgi:hypothetical protein
MGKDNKPPQKPSVTDTVKKFKEQHQMSEEAPKIPEGLPKEFYKDIINEENIKDGIIVDNNPQTKTNIPLAPQYKPNNFENVMKKETDPNLMTAYELIKLPSKGVHYKHKIGEVEIEYMTSKDEDLITTPSLIESGRVNDLLLNRKIKTQGIVASELLPGDKNAILLFLRISSYGNDYGVNVYDPRTGVPFETVVNLSQLQYKEVTETPDENGYFSVELPMRKKTVKFRLISGSEENAIFQQADDIKEAMGVEFSEYNTMKIKAQIVSIGDNSDKEYIGKFVDAMPALDSTTIRKKILKVSPDVDMSYEFTAKDGFKFKSVLTVGVDFFSPGI